MTLHNRISITALITHIFGGPVKIAFVIFSLFASTVALGQAITLKDYNWKVTDIADKGLTKELLFNEMDRKFVRLRQSICSNRAHLWVSDFEHKYELSSTKVFLFYTKKEDDRRALRTWWYHVAPAVNENGRLWVMDAGFPVSIKTPLLVKDWLFGFAESKNCKEILAHETDLIELIFSERAFPKTTRHGEYDCYYRIVPHTFWTPNIVAENLLGKDSNGNPVRTERPEIDKSELYQACIEATTSNIGWALGSSKKKCREYVETR